MQTISVLLPHIFRKSFDYLVPEGMEVETGSYVHVPFGSKYLWGVVWGESSGEVTKLKTILEVSQDIPHMQPAMMKFIEWVAWYTQSPLGMVLKMAISVPQALENKLWKAQKISLSEITPFIPTLSHEQNEAVTQLGAKLDKGFSVSLLDGVTGSGKTEVYFDMIARCLEKEQQILVLLPEISLSVQWLQRFQKRFGFAPTLWHSSVTPAGKRLSWQRIAKNETKVVVGARSSLFLPFSQLGLIIIDEEHEASYKQEEGVIYHARDMAIARAKQEDIPILLVSATPSLETEYNVKHRNYHRIPLSHRHNEATLPAIQLIDMRKQVLAKNHWIATPLKMAIEQTLEKKHQAMVFMNRRGYAPLILCRACGHRFHCVHCSTCLVMHAKKGKLLCHHCGYTAPLIKHCTECNTEHSIIPFGPGVERIEEELRSLFPQARIAVMTSDHSEGGEANENIVTQMIAGEIDILVGTQMVAKGHHFAGLALVGIVDADMGLNGGDLRASERNYQLLHQLSGRAGRAEVKGAVLIQTYQPEHPVMQALLAGDRDNFLLAEAEIRQEAEMPPYGKLAALIIEGNDELEVQKFARELIVHAPPCNVLVLGPAPAPLVKINSRFRYRILIKAERNFSMQKFIQQWMEKVKIPGRIKVKIDIDPYSFL